SVLWHGLVSKVVLPAVLSPIIAAGVAACGTWLLYRITRSLTDGARKHGFRIGQIVSQVGLPAILSPIIAALVAACGTWLLYRITRSLTEGARKHGFRIGQVGSACVVSLAHGTNDAQKTMGVITLALIAHGTLAAKSNAPIWVIVACAIAISAGTYLGGWRVIRTLGKGLVEIESPQGMAAESASAAVILLSSTFGYSLSTTHVATGSIIGTGLGKKGADVRWNVAGRMATAWVFTLPSAAIVGATAYGIAYGIGGTIGVSIDLIILAALSGFIFWRSRATKVDHNNVNAEWTGGGSPDKVPPETGAACTREGVLKRSRINLTARWKIVVFGLIAGAGLPALFAGGLYALSLGPKTAHVRAAGVQGDIESDVVVGGSVMGMVLARLAFLLN